MVSEVTDGTAVDHQFDRPQLLARLSNELVDLILLAQIARAANRPAPQRLDLLDNVGRSLAA